MIKRREFILSVAVTIMARGVFGLHRHEDNLPQGIDWEEVLNRVIGDRNALIAGMKHGHQPYEVGSPEWIMEEVLAGECWLAEGEPVHL